MDLSYFMRERTALIRLFYDRGHLPFADAARHRGRGAALGAAPVQPGHRQRRAAIRRGVHAGRARERAGGLFAVSLLSDTLKGYFEELERDLGIEFKDDKARRAHFRPGWVEAYRQIIEHVMGDAYATCTVRFDLIEQVVLARNDFAHNTDFVLFQAKHNKQTLLKHRNPFFVGPDHKELTDEDAIDLQETPPWWGGPRIEISEEKLMTAIAEVEKLADWVQSNEAVMWAWQRRGAVWRD